MTIEYKDSKRIVGLSTDKLPSSTYETDFSSTTGWSVESGGITYVDSIHYNHPSGVAMNTGVLYDLTTSNVSETSWTLDYDLNITTSTGGSGSSCQLFIGLSNNSTVSSSAIDTAQDYLGHFMIEAAGTHAIRKGNGSDSPEDPVGTVFSRALEADVLYCRLQRISENKGTLSFYSDQGRTSLIESKDITITTSLAGLRYLKVILACKTTSGTHVMVGDITNMKFWNTITSGIESKPTDVQDNSILVEKDTARRYWRTGRGADTTSSQTSFNNDSKIENGASQYDFSGQQFLSGHSLIGKSVSSISFWLWNIGSGSTSGATYSFGILDSNGNLKGSVFGTNNVSDITQASSYSGATKRTMTTSTPVTIEANDIIAVRTNQALTSTAYDIEIGSGGNGSIENNARRARGSANNVTEDDNRDVAYEVIQATPATWTMQPTYQTDFSSSTGWTFKDSAKASISGGSLSFDFEDNSGNDDSCYYDLGSTMSDTKWLLRFKINWTTFDENSRCWFGLADNTTAQNVAKDFIGLLTHKYAGTANWESMDKSNASLDFAGENSSSTTISTSTDYWVQIRRLTDTTYDIKVYDDSGYTSLVDTVLGTMSASSISGLRYIMFYNRNDHETSYNQVGTIDDLSFYNGVTTPN